MESSGKLWKGTEPMLFLATAWALAFLFGRAQRGKSFIKISRTYCPLNKDQKKLLTLILTLILTLMFDSIFDFDFRLRLTSMFDFDFDSDV